MACQAFLLQHCNSDNNGAHGCEIAKACKIFSAIVVGEQLFCRGINPCTLESFWVVFPAAGDGDGLFAGCYRLFSDFPS
jgi:hypothetical protein